MRILSPSVYGMFIINQWRQKSVAVAFVILQQIKEIIANGHKK